MLTYFRFQYVGLYGKMIAILILVSLVLANALELNKDTSQEIKQKISRYFDNTADIKDQYVMHPGFSRFLNKFFKRKLNAFPVFKVNVKFDRKNPVRIPWALGENGSDFINKDNGERFPVYIVNQQRHIKHKKRHSKKLVAAGNRPPTRSTIEFTNVTELPTNSTTSSNQPN